MSRKEIEERSGMLQEEISKEEIRRGVGKLKKGKDEIVCGISGDGDGMEWRVNWSRGLAWLLLQ